MEAWAHRKNIERLAREFGAETDPAKRRTLAAILDLERARLHEIEQAGVPPRP